MLLTDEIFRKNEIRNKKKFTKTFMGGNFPGDKFLGGHISDWHFSRGHFS